MHHALHVLNAPPCLSFMPPLTDFLSQRHQTVINNITSWAKSKNLFINVNKTREMAIIRKNKASLATQSSITGTTRVTSMKILQQSHRKTINLRPRQQYFRIMGPSINDVMHQGEGVKHFVTMCDEGGGGVENVTSHNSFTTCV